MNDSRPEISFFPFCHLISLENENQQASCNDTAVFKVLQNKRGLEQVRQYFTGSANFHFLLPAFLGLAFADCAVDEPAKLAGLKLPGGAMFASLGGAFFDSPAGFEVFLVDSGPGKQEEYLAFHMGRYFPPPLLVTMDSLY